MKWKNIKVGDKLKDGSVVTQIHRTHEEDCCKVIYDNDQEFTCSYNHILLIDTSKIPEEGKKELAINCTFVPLEEDYYVFSDKELSLAERLVVDKFCNNEPIDIEVTPVENDKGEEIYDFHFDKIKRVTLQSHMTKWEPQRVEKDTYWLTCRGIEYLMKKYNKPLYCNGMIINKIIPMGKLPCFCISTDTGRYET